ncbi:MAG TPA: hypothetical protein VGC41_09940 [Kofleriaceae bacterium]
MRSIFVVPLALIACALIACALIACGGPRYRPEHAGTGVTFVSARGQPVAQNAGIAVERGAYDLTLHFNVPRAEVVEWTVTCPGAGLQGAVGETFEVYRTHRLAELRAEAQQRAKTAGAVASFVVGAVAPRTTVIRHDGPVTTSATVDPGAAAGQAAANPVDPQVELAPGDVGGGPLATTVHFATDAPGACVVTAVADDPNVIARFDLVHIRDLEAEQFAHEVAVVNASTHTRAQLTAQLATFGADPQLRAKQRAVVEAEHARVVAARDEERTRIAAQHAAELRAHAEAELQIRGEAEAKLERDHAYAMEIRARWRVLLVSWGADVEYRARLRARHAAEQLRAEEDRARRAALEIDLALRARMSLRAHLVLLGAIERPPMPALPVENRGPAPFDGAAWIAGRYTWTGTAWSWTAGGWADHSTSFGEAGGEAAITTTSVAAPPVVTETPVVVETPTITGMKLTIVRDHHSTPVRDHRDAPKPKVRDHR